MSRILILDAGPLGMITNPKATAENDACRTWLASQVAAGATVVVPEIADYEVRRELLRAGKLNGLARLNSFKSRTYFLPINTVVMLKAADLWATARRMGKAAADDKALDGDMILVAQTLLATVAPTFNEENEVLIATTNVKHLSTFADARHWRDIA